MQKKFSVEKIQTKLKPPPTSDRDWLEWMGIEKSNRDALIEKANRLNIPVFNEDTEKDIYERLASAETLKLNKKTVYINIFLALVALVSALVSILSLRT